MTSVLTQDCGIERGGGVYTYYTYPTTCQLTPSEKLLNFSLGIAMKVVKINYTTVQAFTLPFSKPHTYFRKIMNSNLQKILLPGTYGMRFITGGISWQLYLNSWRGQLTVVSDCSWRGQLTLVFDYDCRGQLTVISDYSWRGQVPVVSDFSWRGQLTVISVYIWRGQLTNLTIAGRVSWQ